MPDIMEAIEGRRSIRKYKDQQISREALDAILRAGMLAPSASNKQPWHFIAIQDQALICIRHGRPGAVRPPVPCPYGDPGVRGGEQQLEPL